MPKFVLIDRTGTLKTVNAKDFSEETLYKKAGFKSAEGFKLQHYWGADDGLDQSICLYGKTKGKAGQENKYDFPPPVDNQLFFGQCILIGRDGESGDVVDLEEDDWEDIYEFLFGGFEEIGIEDSEDEEELDTDDEVEAIAKSSGVAVVRTKQGYAKDGFIIDDDEDAYDPMDASSEEDEIASKPIANKSKGRPKKNASVQIQLKSNSAKPIEFSDTTQPEMTIEDCESELSEESYE